MTEGMKDNGLEETTSLRNEQGKKNKAHQASDDEHGIAEMETIIASAANIEDFKVVKWKLKPSSLVVRQFFAKRHEGTKEDPKKPFGHTLLVFNVPGILRPKQVRQIFKTFGPIHEVILQEKPSSQVPAPPDPYALGYHLYGYQVAYIVFLKSKSVDEFMQLDQDEIEPIALNQLPPTGLAKWVYQYNSHLFEPEKLRKEITKFIQKFDKEEIVRKEQEKNVTEDDEGWVTVTRGNKRKGGGIALTEQIQERLRAKKRKADKRNLRFSATAIKETKAKEIERLKKKFQEDKEKVARMKQERKFKPF